MKKYTLYHIKAVKWGMTTDLKRRMRNQGYTISDCCEFEYYDDIDVGADREKELNIKFGYPWNDGQDYRIIMKAHSKTYTKTERVWNGRKFTEEECKLGGYITGKYPTEKARRARKKNMEKLNQEQTCPYCGKIGRGLGYNRWHGNNCRSKK